MAGVEDITLEHLVTLRRLLTYRKEGDFDAGTGVRICAGNGTQPIHAETRCWVKKQNQLARVSVCSLDVVFRQLTLKGEVRLNLLYSS